MSRLEQYKTGFRQLSAETLDTIYKKLLNGDNQGMGRIQKEALCAIWHEHYDKEIKGI